MVPELTLFTALIVGCFRESAGLELFPDCANDLSHLLAQPGREDHAITPSRPPVPHIAFRDLDTEHFFETERLRAKLEIGGRAVPDARLVLDRPDRPGFDLHHIGPARETKELRTTAECRGAPCGRVRADAVRRQPADGRGRREPYVRYRSKRRRSG